MDYEHRFRRAGLPLFIENYTAAGDVFTRAASLLTLVFIVEMLGAIDLDWHWAANVAAALGGLAVLIAAFALSNRLRDRPLLARPERVGKTELALFVIVPALVPLIFGGQLRSALATAAGNVALLVLVYLVVGYALPSILRGAVGRLGSELALSVMTLARAVPLLLLFAAVLFLSAEMWEVIVGIPPVFEALLGGSFVLFGLLFLIAQLPEEVQRMEREFAAGFPLNRRQRVNVALIMLVSHALQVLVVTLAVGAALVGFGMLAIPPALQDGWTGQGSDVLVAFDLLGEEATITAELLRVAGGVAALSGFYYAIAVLTDATYRDQFLDRLSSDMEDVFEDRARYLLHRGAGTEPAQVG